jgi:hypothetical protein
MQFLKIETTGHGHVGMAHNKSRWEVNFEKGDEVRLNIKNFHLPEELSHKFLGPYVGPFKVLEKKISILTN